MKNSMPKSVHISDNTNKEGFRFMEIKKFNGKTFKYYYRCENGAYDIQAFALDGTSGWQFIASKYDVMKLDVPPNSISYVTSPKTHVPVKDYYWKEFDKLISVCFGD